MTPLRTPWIGNEYQSQKHKILFVGESHYSENYFDASSQKKELTIECVKQYSNGDWKNRTWGIMITQFGRIFGVTVGEENSRKKFFDKIAYVNYIQHCMRYPSESPFNYYIHNEDYRQHFYNIIEEFKPDYVILNSQRLNDLWNYEHCGIAQFLKDKNIGYHHTKHLSKITNAEKIHIQAIVDKILA